MGFFGKILRAITHLPAIVAGVESLFGSKSGSAKKGTVISVVSAIIGFSEAVAAKDIVDDKAFQDGMSQAIEGVVKMLNASVWYK